MAKLYSGDLLRPSPEYPSTLPSSSLQPTNPIERFLDSSRQDILRRAIEYPIESRLSLEQRILRGDFKPCLEGTIEAIDPNDRKTDDWKNTNQTLIFRQMSNNHQCFNNQIWINTED